METLTPVATRGRRPGQSSTREAILDAARSSFARNGFERTTIRAIAKRARVDPALVIRSYGSKDQLFDAVMALPFDPDAISEAIGTDPDQIGERIARFFFSMWDDPKVGSRMLGLIRCATSHEQAAAILRRIVEQAILARIAANLPPGDAPLRADLIASQLIGVGFARYVIRLEPLASANVDSIVGAIGPTIQRYATGPIDSEPKRSSQGRQHGRR